LARLGGGERDVCVPAAGPPEVAGLARSFNALSAALQAARDQNMRLQMQAELLAEEERADIARDLHDEVGPLLFAITAFTAAIGRLAAASDMGAIPSQLRSIQDATSAIQSRVRDMLGRLSDVTEQPVPLAERLRGLAAFWCRVQPEVDVALRVDDAAACLDGRVAEALFRVAQESVSNAMRHGQPRRVSVTVERLAAKVVLRIADDGKGGEAAAGFGMASMRARLAAIGGHLDVAEDSGWTVTATAPLHGRIRNVPASGGQAAVA
jgi:two-component system sensor histidine kinase UhpB